MTDANRQTLVDHLENDREALVLQAVDAQYERHPEIWEKYGERGRQFSLRDQGFLYDYLSEALARDDDSLFTDYATWLKVLFENLGFPASSIADHLECSREALQQTLPADVAAPGVALLDKALETVSDAPTSLPTYLPDDLPLQGLATEYLERLLSGDRRGASTLILDAVDGGAEIRDVYLQVFQRCQWEVGRLWHLNQVTVAQEHFCSAATQLIMSQLAPRIFAAGGGGPSFVGACVGGELHEIGLRMVSDFLELAGWNTYFLGANAPTSAIIKALEEQQARVLGLSASLPLHLKDVAGVVAAVRATPAVADVKILVGGYVFRNAPDRAQRVGADGFAADADQAVQLATSLVQAA